jgi:low temperature requirement protein LtrA
MSQQAWPPGEPPGPRRPAAGPAPDEPQLRVTTLELFFDLVFAFTLTQLTALLSGDLALTGLVQVLMIFGLLWWMYGGYAWLTNARPPVHTAERLLMLVAMAGFLTAGLAIPHSFGRDGVVFGLGYLTVVLVHAWLYFRVNKNIIRLAPFNVASALLVIIAGLIARRAGSPGLAGYLLWFAALAVQLGSPLIVAPAGLFEIRPAHFVERHGALLIVALGESVAAVGIGATRLRGGVSVSLVTASVLGLALAAALWWALFGTGDDDAAERVLASAATQRRSALALSAFFYGNIPLLLGIVAIATGVQQAIERSIGQLPGAPATGAVALAAGAALFLAGDVAFRRLLGLGPVLIRSITAAAAAATIAIGVAVTVEAQLALVAAMLAAMLVAEHYLAGGGPATGDVAAG